MLLLLLLLSRLEATVINFAEGKPCVGLCFLAQSALLLPRAAKKLSTSNSYYYLLRVSSLFSLTYPLLPLPFSSLSFSSGSLLPVFFGPLALGHSSLLDVPTGERACCVCV